MNRRAQRRFSGIESDGRGMHDGKTRHFLGVLANHTGENLPAFVKVRGHGSHHVPGIPNCTTQNRQSANHSRVRILIVRRARI